LCFAFGPYIAFRTYNVIVTLMSSIFFRIHLDISLFWSSFSMVPTEFTHASSNLVVHAAHTPHTHMSKNLPCQLPHKVGTYLPLTSCCRGRIDPPYQSTATYDSACVPLFHSAHAIDWSLSGGLLRTVVIAREAGPCSPSG
jgi:hypothetical protein